MNPTLDNFTHEATKGITFEDQTTPCKPENKQRIKPIFRRTSNWNRKRGPTLLDSVRSKNASFGKFAVHLHKENKLYIQLYEVKTFQRGLHSVCVNLKVLRSLQKFSLRSPNLGVKLTNMNFSDITQTLKRTVSLQSLELDIADCENITDKGFYYLGKGLERLSSLKHFDFRFGFSSKLITDEGLKYLSKSLKRLTSLESLILDFRSCSDFTDFGVSTLSANLKNLLLLKSLKICFSSSRKLTEQRFLDLCDSLERFVCLQNLKLDLAGFRMTDVGSKRFGEMLNKFISLQSLAINLSNYGTTDLGFCELFRGIKDLVCLQDMKIDASYSVGMNNKKLFYLSKALKRLVCLKNLEINLQSYHNNFNDEGLSHFHNGLKKLKSLEKLTVKMGKLPKITDQGVLMLGQGVKDLAFLQEVSVSFSASENFTNEGAQNFSRELKDLSNLKRLDFHVSQCPNFTDNGLEMMCQVLKDIPSLEKFAYEQANRPTVLYVKFQISEALEFPKKYFPNYKSGLEEQEKPKEEKRSFWKRLLFFAKK